MKLVKNFWLLNKFIISWDSIFFDSFLASGLRVSGLETNFWIYSTYEYISVHMLLWTSVVVCVVGLCGQYRRDKRQKAGHWWAALDAKCHPAEEPREAFQLHPTRTIDNRRLRKLIGHVKNRNRTQSNLKR